MSDYERAAERIWDSPPHTTKEEIAAILREEFLEREAMAKLWEAANDLVRAMACNKPKRLAFEKLENLLHEIKTDAYSPELIAYYEQVAREEFPPAPDVAALRKAILSFCANEQWAVKEWKDQPHIKSLFDLAVLLRSEPKEESHE